MIFGAFSLILFSTKIIKKLTILSKNLVTCLVTLPSNSQDFTKK